nr:MAG TPA: hypothetical protein [Crassvirales sp.]
MCLYLLLRFSFLLLLHFLLLLLILKLLNTCAYWSDFGHKENELITARYAFRFAHYGTII